MLVDRFRAFIFILMALIFWSSDWSLAANESAQTVTLDGILYKKGTTSPLIDSSVQLKIQILNPAGTCLLYEETQTVNTSTSKGYFNIQVGSSLSAIKRTVNDPGNLMARVFQNSVAIPSINAPGQSCAGLSYVPSAGDIRYFRLTVTPSSTSVADTLSPDIILDSVPQALVAQSLQGLERAQVLAVNTAGGVSLDQSNLESLFTGPAWTNLQSILNGNFLRTDSSGATLPAYASTPAGVSIGDMWYDSTTNEIKYQSNSGVQALGTVGMVSGSSITSGTISGSTSINTTGNLFTSGNISGSSITGSTMTASIVSASSVQGSTITGSLVQATNLRIYSGSQYVQLTAQPISSSYTLALPTADGVSGQVMATNGLGTLSWVTPSGGVAGTISVGQGGTAATSFAANRIIASNGTGSALQGFSCSLNQFISFDASGNAICANAGMGNISNGGNSAGAAISIGTNDNQALQLKANNTVAMTISQNGSVGIGTSNPGSLIDIQSTNVTSTNKNKAVSFSLQKGATAINLWGIVGSVDLDGSVGGPYSQYLGDLTMNKSAGNDAMNGLKLTMNQWGGTSANTTTLSLHNDFSGGTLSSRTGIMIQHIGSSSPTTDTGIYVQQYNSPTNKYGIYLEQLGGANIYGIYADGSAKNYFGGSIGIGLDSPTSALDISGSFTAQGLSSAPGVSPSRAGRIFFDYATNKFRVSENGGAYQDLLSTGGSVSGAILNGGNSTAATISIGTNDNQALQFKANNTVAMTISQNGNVSIGGAPDSKLQLKLTKTAGGSQNTVTSGAVVDMSLANIHLLKSVGGSSITLQNLATGVTYSIFIDDLTSRTYTFSGCNNTYFSPANSPTDFRSIYTISTIDNAGLIDCYVSWQTGFN